MITAHNLLLTALRSPESMISFKLAEWDLLVRQARHADLLARVCVLLEEEGLLNMVPREARNHLESELMVAKAHGRVVRWEGYQIQKTLEHLKIPVILLKGAAYVLGDLPPGRGRLFHDVDILVPRNDLDAIEEALLRNGWMLNHLDQYDQRYYRQWMHQLPPLRHIKRKTVLDVHHTILPKTAQFSPDPLKLISDSQPLNGQGCLKILSATDMVLHSATHLFHEGEFHYGLRDLVDLDRLLAHFGRDNDFWSQLLARADELDLSRPLYYALRYTRAILGTAVPEQIDLNALKRRPRGLAPALMDFLFYRVLLPDHPSCKMTYTRIARWFLYVRGHALRMPLYLLIPHLIRKSIKRRKDA